MSKNLAGILTGITLKSTDQFEEINIFTMLSLSIHEHVLSPHLFIFFHTGGS
jgi:hypothetical protein